MSEQAHTVLMMESRMENASTIQWDGLDMPKCFSLEISFALQKKTNRTIGTCSSFSILLNCESLPSTGSELEFSIEK